MGLPKIYRQTVDIVHAYSTQLESNFNSCKCDLIPLSPSSADNYILSRPTEQIYFTIYVGFAAI